jgi:hypothetical protein
VCFRPGIVHGQTTIQAFQMIGFQMRGVRSAGEQCDATERAGFWVLVKRADHFAFAGSRAPKPLPYVYGASA